MAVITEFGKAIKIRLIGLNRSQNWLIEAVKEKTGLFFDDSYLYKILTGDRNPEKIVTAIREILEMEEA